MLKPDLLSVATAHTCMVYTCAFARSEIYIFKKTLEIRVGRRQFYAGVNGILSTNIFTSLPVSGCFR